MHNTEFSNNHINYAIKHDDLLWLSVNQETNVKKDLIPKPKHVLSQQLKHLKKMIRARLPSNQTCS